MPTGARTPVQRSDRHLGTRIQTAVRGRIVHGIFHRLAVVSATPAQALTGFSNGSFETPVVTPNTFVNLGAGASIGAWTVSQGHVDLTGKSFATMGYVHKVDVDSCLVVVCLG
jgi:hypothetical protein